ncbi:MAG: T9SS type A sorting domain-containing protein [Fluviicola sp.]|nr:T9SS type A sorting domain-containing protein [Fluviicola sp.]
MKKTLPLLAILISHLSFSQDATFSKLFYDTNGVNLSTQNAISNHENGVLLIGNYGVSNEKGSIILVDSLGAIVWSKTLDCGPISATYPGKLTTAIATSDSGYVITGMGFNPVSGNYDALTFKLNAQGDTLWTNSINSITTTGMEGASVIETADSGYMVLGNNDADSELFLAKLDQSGTLVESFAFSAPETIHAETVKQAPDSSYYIAGDYTTSLGTNGFIAHISSNGQFDWAKEYENYPIKDIIVTETGILAQGIHQVPFSNRLAVMKTDISGAFSWEREYTGPLYLYDYSRIIQLTDTTFAIFANEQPNYGSITIIDENGNMPIFNQFWVSMFTTSISAATDGTIYIAGNGPNSALDTSMLMTRDYIGLVKYDYLNYNPLHCIVYGDVFFNETAVITSSNLNFSNGTGKISHSIFVDYSDLEVSSTLACLGGGPGIEEYMMTDLSVYPNASAGNFYFDQETQNRTIQLVVFDSFGKKVHLQELSGNSTLVNLSALASGVYYYRAMGSDSTSTTGKLIIEK